MGIIYRVIYTVPFFFPEWAPVLKLLIRFPSFSAQQMPLFKAHQPTLSCHFPLSLPRAASLPKQIEHHSLTMPLCHCPSTQAPSVTGAFFGSDVSFCPLGQQVSLPWSCYQGNKAPSFLQTKVQGLEGTDAGRNNAQNAHFTRGQCFC